jgi:hypothetical protein
VSSCLVVQDLELSVHILQRLSVDDAEKECALMLAR